MIRLVISPSPRSIRLPDNYQLSPGKGVALTAGSNAVLFAYGPVMLNEALRASEELKRRDFALKVVNLPWLNRIDPDWLAEVVGTSGTIFVLDNHSTYGGLGDQLLNALMNAAELHTRRLIKFGVEEYPACGTPAEALAYHRLDGPSLAARILQAMKHN